MFKIFGVLLFFYKKNIKIFLDLRSERLDVVNQAFIVSNLIKSSFFILIDKYAFNESLDSFLAINKEFISFEIVTKVIQPLNFVRFSIQNIFDLVQKLFEKAFSVTKLDIANLGHFFLFIFPFSFSNDLPIFIPITASPSNESRTFVEFFVSNRCLYLESFFK